MAKIIYTGGFRFPDGDAAAARVLGIGKAMHASGHEVIFAGWEKNLRFPNVQNDGLYFQGFQYFSQNDLPTTKANLWKRIIRFFRYGNNTLRWLKSLDLNEIEAVIVYGGTSLFLLKIKSLCKRYDIKLIVDVTEWIDSQNLPGGRLSLPYWDSEIRMRFVNVAIGEVIAISSYLEGYYLSRGCNVLCVPPLVDLDEEKWKPLSQNSADNERLHIAYAGTPGKKDLLGNVLKGIHILKKESIFVKLHIIGPSRESVAMCLGNDVNVMDDIEDCLIFHGRVSQKEVPQLLFNADFSVLLRPQKRYAQAGFATKFVESMAIGVPVLANQTGDITKYIHDDMEGILLYDHSPEAFAIAVKHAIALPLIKRIAMRKDAKQQAQRSFDYRVYVEKINHFLQ